MTFSLSRFCSSDLVTLCATRLRRVAGWRRCLLAFMFGGLMALSMPPFDVFPLLWVCLPALIFLLQGVGNYKQAFFTGWCFAFGFFVFGLYWIADSMFVDIAHFWWAVPLSVAGLPAFFAVYYGIAAIVARRVGLSGGAGAVAFGLLWFLADYARGHMFTGFPWNLIGYAWSGCLPVLQVTSVIGIYGLGVVTAVAACLPASLMPSAETSVDSCARYRSRRIPAFAGMTRHSIVVVSLLLFVVFAIGGEIRLLTTDVGTVPNVRVRLVQPNISQKEKWKFDARADHFEGLLDLSAMKSDVPVTHVFWPETASPYYLTEETMARQELAARMTSSTAAVMTGVIRRSLDEKGDTQFYNSLVAVDRLGRVVAGYDKSHLVPFGEFMPLRRYNPLPILAASASDFSSGAGVRSLRVNGLPLFSPLICYEAIFPGDVVDRDDRPGFMLNATNDGWYGQTTGPYQHFAIVRVRAIEEGLPLLRVANTGISGVIDPLGRVKERLGLGKRGYVDSDLPEAIPLTLFSKFGEYPVWGLFVFAMFGVLVRGRTIKKG